MCCPLQWLVYFLWLVAEVAIAATDLAEIIGSATALNLLFNIPLWAGVLITALDVLLVIAFGIKNFRLLEVIFPPPEGTGSLFTEADSSTVFHLNNLLSPC
jgi:NRAMP (natural resistance-associated macrophage protein)-like metal ion transporter